MQKFYSLGFALALLYAMPARSDDLRIGLIDMFAGGFTAQADAIRTGFQVAIDEANAEGGAGGQKFALQTADMGTSVEKAITEARRMMLDDKLSYVTIGSHSGAAVALADMVKGTDVFGLGAFATTKRFTGEEGNPMVGRGNLSTVEIGRIMAETLKTMPEIKRIATIAPDFEFGQHFTDDFIAALKIDRPDIVIVRKEFPKFGAADFTPQVTALQAAPIDMVVSGLFSGDLNNFLKAAKGFDLFGSGIKFFNSGVDLLKISTFKDTIPEGSLATVWYPFYAIHNPANTAFVATVEKRTGTYPNGSTLVGYVSGKMLVESIRRAAKPNDPSSMVKAMGGLEFDSPVGPVKVRACDNSAQYDFYVGTIKRDASLPDGIGVVNVKAYNTADYARTCEEIAKLRSP
jgi:branched-chain amino acid transport system substrate-binding protein